ncbi:MAG: protein-L-isoaspartate(D-aspartate) O-methyltransferase [Planctomycetes bacterium]|nr:protein-L-isoaspartate(D-aspartate) O-methyltransferase [Planctomycetota bacterium]
MTAPGARRFSALPTAILAAGLFLLLAAACRGREARANEPGAGTVDLTGDRQGERDRMVKEQIEARGVRDQRVLAAMRAVPRHRFVPAEVRDQAYDDTPLPIGMAQTISQPYIVAFMTEALGLVGGEKVLEIGTGSGYQAAVLAQLDCRVFSIEIVAPLAERARADLAAAGLAVEVRSGDGYRGWPEQAPFDAVIVTAAPEHVPAPLVEQLAVGGRMVLPVGGFHQELVLLEKTATGVTRRSILPVRFVPMTGEARQRR